MKCFPISAVGVPFLSRRSRGWVRNAPALGGGSGASRGFATRSLAGGLAFASLAAPLTAQDFTCAFDTVCDADGACAAAQTLEVLSIGVDRPAARFRIGDETFTEVTLESAPPDAIAFGRPDEEVHAGVFRFVDIAGTAILLIEGDALGLGHTAMSGTCGVAR